MYRLFLYIIPLIASIVGQGHLSFAESDIDDHIDPLDQFEIKHIVRFGLFGYDFSFTNSSLVMLVSLLIIFILGVAAGLTRSKSDPKSFLMKANLPFNILLLIYNTTYSIIESTTGEKPRKEMLNFMFSLFIFILIMNLIGTLPFSFSPTSHFVVNAVMSFTVFMISLAISIKKHGLRFFSIFVPNGVPKSILPLIFFLEVISYLIRPFSLLFRLTCNIMVGHVVLEIIAFLVIISGAYGFLPFAGLNILSLFEIFVAILQAYIFTLLSSIYVAEALKH